MRAEDFKIEERDYGLEFDAESGRVLFRGALRLQGPRAYDEIKKRLHQVLDAVGPGDKRAVLDFRGLRYLNSSGITTLAAFVVEARERGAGPFIARGSKDVAWQAKSLANLARLWDGVTLEFLSDTSEGE